MKSNTLKLTFLVTGILFLAAMTANGLVSKSLYVGAKPVFTPSYTLDFTPSITTKGHSMEPTMHDGLYEIERLDWEKLQLGDIAIWWDAAETRWVAHRIIATAPSDILMDWVETQGDNNPETDGTVPSFVYSGWIVKQVNGQVIRLN